ncbi:MAG: alpha/beta fold hydrolase [Rhodospirillaceae bacterium]
MAEHTSERIEIDGCGIEVLRGGKGPALVFLHGAGGAHAWAPYMDRLAEHYTLHVPSHPGYGRSDTPDWLDGIGDLAYFYLDYLERVGDEAGGRVHLVGNSLGGWLALEIAVRSTARISTLTLVGSAGIHVAGVPKGDIFLWGDEERVRNTYFDQSLAEARLAQQGDEEQTDISLKNHFTTAKLAWSPRFYNPELQKWLHRVRVPTFILWGDSDRILPPAYGEAMQSLIPGSTLSILPECGHLPHQEKLDEFVAGVTAHTNGAAS